MAVYKCKMCGANLQVMQGKSLCKCDYCDTLQTVTTSLDEELQTLFNRANYLRLKSEFDKSKDVYEKILLHDDTDPEAYWGLVLCEYGIEYVEDVATGKRIPTCHRASYESVAGNEDYKNALKYADEDRCTIYKKEAEEIERIQREIIALAQKDEQYDVFICYKEADEEGKRTKDSVIANEIYYHLVEEGFKVFYAAISLEDQIGEKYEPHIFAALNTAKVMLVIGTKPEYFNSVWVRNEWSRFLKIMKRDRSRYLIPCYRDMDPYDLPEEFAHLQGQDMGKIGFVNDLVRGIKKVMGKGNNHLPNNNSETIQPRNDSGIESLIKRGYFALEDKEWKKADDFFESVLNQNAENGEAYFGKLLVKHKLRNIKEYFNALKQKSFPPRLERHIACKENVEHIDDIIREHANALLTDQIIRELYAYDRAYESITEDRRYQKLMILAEMNSDVLLNRAKKNASAAFKNDLLDEIKEINTYLDDRMEEAKKIDESNARQIKKKYNNYIAWIDVKILEYELLAQGLMKRKKRKRIIGFLLSIMVFIIGAILSTINGDAWGLVISAIIILEIIYAISCYTMTDSEDNYRSYVLDDARNKRNKLMVTNVDDGGDDLPHESYTEVMSKCDICGEKGVCHKYEDMHFCDACFSEFQNALSDVETCDQSK